MVFGHKTKPNFAVENEAQIQQAPSVDFGAPSQPALQPAPAVAKLPQPVLPPVQGGNAPPPVESE